jgi:hypothetical protein
MGVQSAARVCEDERLRSNGAKEASSLTPAQKRGLKYQAKVEKELLQLFPGRVIPRPWFRYKQDWVVKRCEPDLLLETDSGICVVEVKYSTIPEAWGKLNKVYGPVVKQAYRVPVALALITRRFDPAVRFDCCVTQLEGLEALLQWRGEGLGVVSWR